MNQSLGSRASRFERARYVAYVVVRLLPNSAVTF